MKIKFKEFISPSLFDVLEIAKEYGSRLPRNTHFLDAQSFDLLYFPSDEYHQTASGKVLCSLYKMSTDDFGSIRMKRTVVGIAQVPSDLTHFIVYPPAWFSHYRGFELSAEELKEFYEHFLFSGLVFAPVLFHSSAEIRGLNYEETINSLVKKDEDIEQHLSPPETRRVKMDRSLLYRAIIETVNAKRVYLDTKRSVTLNESFDDLSMKDYAVQRRFMSFVTALSGLAFMVEDVENITEVRSLETLKENFKKFWTEFFGAVNSDSQTPDFRIFDKPAFLKSFFTQVIILAKLDFYTNIFAPTLRKYYRKILEVMSGTDIDSLKEAFFSLYKYPFPESSRKIEKFLTEERHASLFKDSVKLYMMFIVLNASFRKIAGDVVRLDMINPLLGMQDSGAGTYVTFYRNYLGICEELNNAVGNDERMKFLLTITKTVLDEALGRKQAYDSFRELSAGIDSSSSASLSEELKLFFGDFEKVWFYNYLKDNLIPLVRELGVTECLKASFRNI